MAQRCAGFLILLWIASCALAQPSITHGTVTNGASFRTPGLPSSGIAQGSIFSIKGTGLGPNPWVTAPKLPLATQLAGASVAVQIGGTSVDALMLLSYAYQINAILPSNTPVGDGTLTITYNGQSSATEPIHVVANTVGIFTSVSTGYGQASATDLNYSVNSIIHTYHPGDWVTLWATGLGAITGSDADVPTVGNLPGAVTVHVGANNVTPLYAGRSASYPGLDQIAFQVPDGITGCYVPVAVETSGGVSNMPTIAVSSTGNTCSDSILGPDLISRLAAGDTVNFGWVHLESIALHFGSTGPGLPDYGYASFSQYTPATATWASYGVSNGYCLANQYWIDDLSPGQLNAGPSLQVQGQGSATIPGYAGYYAGNLNPSGSKFLWSDLNYSVTGTGGSAVGAFTVSEYTSIATANFSGIVVSQTLSRSGDLKLTWTGGDSTMQSGQVTIGGASFNTDHTLYSYFQCAAPLAPGSFTVPKWVLSLLPPSGSGQTGGSVFPYGYIWLGQWGNSTTFQASGLDRAIMSDIFYTGYPVYFQ